MSAVIQDGEISTPPAESGYLDDFGDLPKSEAKEITLVVFEEYISTATSLTLTSNQLLNGLLGAFDQMAIEIVADRVVSTGSVTLAAQIMHSGDDRDFKNKAAVAEILATSLSTTNPTPLAVGYDDGSLPSLAFIRIRFDLTVSAQAAVHFKCTVTANNNHERAFSRRVEGAIGEYYSGSCDSSLHAGRVIACSYQDDGFQRQSNGRVILAGVSEHFNDHRMNLLEWTGVGGTELWAFNRKYATNHNLAAGFVKFNKVFDVVSVRGHVGTSCKVDAMLRVKPGVRLCFGEHGGAVAVVGGRIIGSWKRMTQARESHSNAK